MTHRRIVKTLAGLAIGAALVVGLCKIQHIDINVLWDRALDPWCLAAAFGVSALYVLSGALKWRMISKTWFGDAPSLGVLFHQTSLTVFWSQFLPLPIATAMQRTWAMRVHGEQTTVQSMEHSAYDLGFDFIAVLVFLMASLGQWHWKLSGQQWLTLNGVGLVFIMALCWLFPLALRFITRFVDHKSRLSSWQATLKAWQSHDLLRPVFMVQMTLLGFARFFLITLRLWLCARAVGLEIGIAPLFYASAPSALPSLIPLTPANLGVAEWTWTYLLPLWGVPLAISATFAILLRLWLLIFHTLLAACTSLIEIKGRR